MFTDNGNEFIICGNVIHKEVFLYAEPNYEFPPNGYTRLYMPGQYHMIYNDQAKHSFHFDKNWEKGNVYIERLNDYLRMQKYFDTDNTNLIRDLENKNGSNI